MNLSLSITGRFFLLLLSQVLALSSRSQTYTAITYAGSGLTVTTNKSTDVLAGDPTIDGYVHQTTSFAGLVNTEGGAMATNSPGFDGTSLILWGNNGLSKVTFNPGTTNQYTVLFTDLVTTAININYPFQAGLNYYITVNYSSQAVAQYTGLGLSIGTPQFSTNMSQAGSAMVGFFGSSPTDCYLDDGFLMNTFYSKFFPIYNTNPTSVTAAVPPVTSATTGLNLETLPSVENGPTDLDIQSIDIVALPVVSGNSNICTTQTYSIANNAGWPISWSISPAGIASLSPSGNSVTATKLSNGSATLTATLTAPNGQNYSLNTPVTAGTLPTPGAIIPGTENVPPNSLAEFNSPNANWWVVTNGTITDGQNGDDIAVKVANISSGTLTVTAYGKDGCGLSTGVTNQYPIVSGSGNPYSINPVIHQDSANSLTQPLNQPPQTPWIYPNPGKDAFQVVIPQLNLTKAFIKVFDLDGKLLQVILPTDQTTRVDVAHLARGTYFVIIFDGKSSTVQKFIKQ